MRKGTGVIRVIVLLIISMKAHTQTLTPSFITLQADISGYSAQHIELVSFVSNPASLTAIKKFSFAFGAEKRYLINELNNYLLVTGFSLPSGYFGASVSYAGFSFYHESVL